MIPEQKLWQTVVIRALTEATAVDPYGAEARQAKREADAWLRRGGKDFRMVCDLAGFDPHFVRDNYVAGRVNGDLLRAAERAEVTA